MRIFKNLAGILILLFLTQVFVGCDAIKNKSVTDLNENAIVVLKFKAQPGKVEEAISEFEGLFEKVRQEPNFGSIKLHIDPNDKTNILLYEEWEDVDYYQNEHMNTDHLKEFMENSSKFLAGPPEVTFWKVKQVYK